MLTPAKHAQLVDVSPDVHVVDFDQEQVEVEALNGHPSKTAEQGVVEEYSSSPAEPHEIKRC